MIKPTIGRVVLYWPLNGQRNHAHAQPFAAMITHVWNDHLVNLITFDESGVPAPRTSVALAQDRQAHDGECGWMEYQLKQAAQHGADV